MGVKTDTHNIALTSVWTRILAVKVTFCFVKMSNTSYYVEFFYYLLGWNITYDYYEILYSLRNQRIKHNNILHSVLLFVGKK